MAESEIIGRPSTAVQSEQILTGRARYTADFDLPGMLYGKLLYSPYACARIKKIDVTEARKIHGVVSVITHKDIPGENTYLYFQKGQPLLAVDRINYEGDAVAAVAARTEELARLAIQAIQVDYEPLIGTFDTVEAMRPGAEQVLTGFDNIASHHVFELGNIENGFAQADVIVDNTYQTQLVEHAYLETEGALAYIEFDGTVVVIASNQAPHRDRTQIARALAIPENQVRVVTPFVGGAFGAKDEAHVQIHAAILAFITKKPVRIIQTREESFRTHVKRHPVTIHYRSGAKKDGKLTALEVNMVGDAGPYANASPFIMGFGASVANGPYYVPNAKIDAWAVRTNNLVCGAMRGFGAPQVAVAYEAQMDALAQELGIDPIEIRLRNAFESGQVAPSGGAIREATAVRSCLLEAARISGWETRRDLSRQPAGHLRRGWGIGSTWFVIGLGRGKDNAVANVEMAPDGAVLVRTGAVELGQGVSSVLAGIAAEILGVELEDVRVITPDTDHTSDAGPTIASRQTFVSGNAVLNAASVIRQNLLDMAAEITGLDKNILDLRHGNLFADGEQLNIPYATLATRAHLANRQMNVNGFYAMEFPQEFKGKGNYFGVGPSSFGTNIAQVLVDIETGEVKVERLVMVHNVGKIINYGGAYGQMTGAAVMGLGYALTEELLLDKGLLLNKSLDQYMIPTTMDIPTVDIKLLEIPEPYGPFGAVGLGEPSLTPVAPSILNAVSDAIGVSLKQIPLTPERILEAIKKNKDNQEK